MKPLSGILLIFSILFLLSCKQKNESPAWEMINNGLWQAQHTTDMQNVTIYHAFESRLMDPDYGESAKIWQPKAVAYKLVADDAYTYIETLKKELMESAGLRMENGQEVFNKVATSPVTLIFLTRGKSKALHTRLNTFYYDMLKIDSLNPVIKKMCMDFDPGNQVDPDPLRIYFSGQTVMAAMAILTNYQNKIRIVQHETALYCLNKTSSSRGCGYMSEPKLLINQSSNCVKPGDTINIKAGVATFYWQPKLVLSIGNKNIPVEDYGMAHHNIKASVHPGKYSMPVKASYYKADGTQSTISSVIRYEVVEENQ